MFQAEAVHVHENRTMKWRETAPPVPRAIDKFEFEISDNKGYRTQWPKDIRLLDNRLISKFWPSFFFFSNRDEAL